MKKQNNNTNIEKADFSGQLKEVKVATSMNVQDHKVKTIKVDRTGHAKQAVLPPTDFSGKRGLHRSEFNKAQSRLAAKYRKEWGAKG